MSHPRVSLKFPYFVWTLSRRLLVCPARLIVPPSRRNWRRWRKPRKRWRNSGRSVRKRPDAADGCLPALTPSADDVQCRVVFFSSSCFLNVWHTPAADCYHFLQHTRAVLEKLLSVNIIKYRVRSVITCQTLMKLLMRASFLSNMSRIYMFI